MEGDLDAGVPGECFKEWHVRSIDGLAEDVIEIPHRLMVVDAKTQSFRVTPPGVAARSRQQEVRWT